MEAINDNYKINEEEGFKDGGFYPVNEALEMITHSQDRSLVSLSYKKYLEYKEFDVNQLYA
jgi:hypothetical protein